MYFAFHLFLDIEDLGELVEDSCGEEQQCSNGTHEPRGISSGVRRNSPNNNKRDATASTSDAADPVDVTEVAEAAVSAATTVGTAPAKKRVRKRANDNEEGNSSPQKAKRAASKKTTSKKSESEGENTSDENAH